MILFHHWMQYGRGPPAPGYSFKMVSDGAPASMFPPLLCYMETFLHLMSTVGNAESPPSTLFQPTTPTTGTQFQHRSERLQSSLLVNFSKILECILMQRQQTRDLPDVKAAEDGKKDSRGN